MNEEEYYEEDFSYDDEELRKRNGMLSRMANMGNIRVEI